MSKPLQDIADKLRETSNPATMTSEEIGTAKSLILYLFKPVLPYKAKNGVYFSTNGVSLTTNHGIVFGDNYGKMNDTYNLMLRHHLSASTGESKYTSSVKISSYGTDALETLSKAIQQTVEQLAHNMLKKFN